MKHFSSKNKLCLALLCAIAVGLFNVPIASGAANPDEPDPGSTKFLDALTAAANNMVETTGGEMSIAAARRMVRQQGGDPRLAVIEKLRAENPPCATDGTSGNRKKTKRGRKNWDGDHDGDGQPPKSATVDDEDDETKKKLLSPLDALCVESKCELDNLFKDFDKQFQQLKIHETTVRPSMRTKRGRPPVANYHFGDSGFHQDATADSDDDYADLTQGAKRKLNLSAQEHSDFSSVQMRDEIQRLITQYGLTGTPEEMADYQQLLSESSEKVLRWIIDGLEMRMSKGNIKNIKEVIRILSVGKHFTTS